LVRKAVIEDVGAIFDLIEKFSHKGVMLYRPAEDIYDSLRDFFVYEEDGTITGVCSLHIWGPELGEIRSLAVKEDQIRKGIGTKLVAACMVEAGNLGLKDVFALTYMRGFFERQGFGVVDKLKLPQKIWGDCTKCGKFPSCDETAVIKSIDVSGELQESSRRVLNNR
jgi:amino-acid N-acetyltransferase